MIPYSYRGEVHYLSIEEFNAVELSGRSVWQDYATEPTNYPSQDHSVVNLMGARPGQTEPGKSPAHAKPKPVADHVKHGTHRVETGTLHMASAAPNHNTPSCGADVPTHEVYGMNIFAKFVGSQKACVHCMAIYQRELNDPNGRRPFGKVFLNKKRDDGYVVPLNWTPEEKAMLKEWRRSTSEPGYRGGKRMGSGIPQRGSFDYGDKPW